MVINLENRVGEITLALSDKGIKANVLVKEEGIIGKKRQQLHITVNGVTEEVSKRNCTVINETMLDKFGYGTSSTRYYKDGTLEVRYTPIREEEKVSDRDYQTTPGAQ